MLKTFDIWSEGYRATGEAAGATKHGEAEGQDFRAACTLFFGTDTHFDPQRLTYWGCRLFDNEGDARKAFG